MILCNSSFVLANRSRSFSDTSPVSLPSNMQYLLVISSNLSLRSSFSLPQPFSAFSCIDMFSVLRIISKIISKGPIHFTRSHYTNLQISYIIHIYPLEMKWKEIAFNSYNSIIKYVDVCRPLQFYFFTFCFHENLKYKSTLFLFKP